MRSLQQTYTFRGTATGDVAALCCLRDAIRPVLHENAPIAVLSRRPQLRHDVHGLSSLRLATPISLSEMKQGVE
eukprot:6201609-Pleurochrysis_carterae.AAC.4